MTPLLATEVLTASILLSARQIIIESGNPGHHLATVMALSVLKRADQMWEAEGNDNRDSRCWYCCSGWGHDNDDHQHSVNDFERSR